MAIYFVSDFHLGEGDREKEQLKVDRFHQFLEETTGDMEHLVILGDMFEFWFEYRHLIPKKNLHLLFELHDLVRRGVRVSYIAGNHDYWMDDFLQRELGIEMCRDKLEIATQRGAILAMHGDGLAKSDWLYRRLKAILRSRTSIALYRLLPPSLAYALAYRMARRSRQHTDKHLPERFLNQYRDYARERLAEGYFAFICGHTHRPEISRIGECYYLNSGDWFDNFSYIRFDGREFELHYLPTDS